MSEDLDLQVSRQSQPVQLGGVVRVGFGLTKNLGNYESVRLDLWSEVEPGQSYEVVVDSLRTAVSAQLEFQPDYENLLDRMRDKKCELVELSSSCERMLDKFKKLDYLWQRVSDELRVNVPEISTLLSSYVEFAPPAVVDSVAAVESQVEALHDRDWEDDEDDEVMKIMKIMTDPLPF